METRSSKKKRTRIKVLQEDQVTTNKRNSDRLVKKTVTKQSKPKQQVSKKYSKKKPARTKQQDNQFPSDDGSINGLTIAKNYIPEELLTEILCYLDPKTLLSCQLVCQRWKHQIQRFVWHKKAERTMGHPLFFDQRTPWMAYYSICVKMPFNRNLIKNHSGEKEVILNWRLPPIKDIRWFIESPPVPPLPHDSRFTEKNHCFLTSSGMSWKYQTVDLVKEGFSKYLLDFLQPPIKVIIHTHFVN